MNGPTLYVTVAGVAAWFNVKPGTVSVWLIRYPQADPQNDIYGWPTPDAYAEPGRNPEGEPDKLWLPSRQPEWVAWKASLPGQGWRLGQNTTGGRR